MIQFNGTIDAAFKGNRQYSINQAIDTETREVVYTVSYRFVRPNGKLRGRAFSVPSRDVTLTSKNLIMHGFASVDDCHKAIEKHSQEHN